MFTLKETTLNMKPIIYIFLPLLSFSVICCNPKKYTIESEFSNVYDRTTKNYGKQIELTSKKFNLPAEYLKALIILESSGNKDVSSRYEHHVYKKLDSLRNHQIISYKKLKPYQLKDVTDAALKNLSTSWGPFQIMGYKCLELGVSVKELRGDSSVYWGVYWIDKEYGQFLKEKKYKEAFRIHNTGSPTGETFDKKYVAKGIAHINYFNSLNNH